MYTIAQTQNFVENFCSSLHNYLPFLHTHLTAEFIPSIIMAMYDLVLAWLSDSMNAFNPMACSTNKTCSIS